MEECSSNENNNHQQENPKKTQIVCNKANTLLIFDWDDTLFPSSWLIKIRKAWREFDRKTLDLLFELEMKVCLLLKNASKIGTVTIISKGAVKWLQYCLTYHMPKLAAKLQELQIPIKSARQMGEFVNCSDHRLWKLAAFQADICSFISNDRIACQKSIEKKASIPAMPKAAAAQIFGKKVTNDFCSERSKSSTSSLSCGNCAENFYEVEENQYFDFTLDKNKATHSSSSPSRSSYSNQCNLISRSSTNFSEQALCSNIPCCRNTGFVQQQFYNILSFSDAMEDRSSFLHTCEMLNEKQFQKIMNVDLGYVLNSCTTFGIEKNNEVFASCKFFQTKCNTLPYERAVRVEEHQQQSNEGTNFQKNSSNKHLEKMQSTGESQKKREANHFTKTKLEMDKKLQDHHSLQFQNKDLVNTISSAPLLRTAYFSAPSRTVNVYRLHELFGGSFFCSSALSQSMLCKASKFASRLRKLDNQDCNELSLSKNWSVGCLIPCASSNFKTPVTFPISPSIPSASSEFAQLFVKSVLLLRRPCIKEVIRQVETLTTHLTKLASSPSNHDLLMLTCTTEDFADAQNEATPNCRFNLEFTQNGCRPRTSDAESTITKEKTEMAITQEKIEVPSANENLRPEAIDIGRNAEKSKVGIFNLPSKYYSRIYNSISLKLPNTTEENCNNSGCDSKNILSDVFGFHQLNCAEDNSQKNKEDLRNILQNRKCTRHVGAVLSSAISFYFVILLFIFFSFNGSMVRSIPDQVSTMLMILLVLPMLHYHCYRLLASYLLIAPIKKKNKSKTKIRLMQHLNGSFTVKHLQVVLRVLCLLK